MSAHNKLFFEKTFMGYGMYPLASEWRALFMTFCYLRFCSNMTLLVYSRFAITLIQRPIEDNSMSTTMRFPIIRSQQVGSISALQSTPQQAGGIDISNILQLIMPVIVIGAMARVTSSMGKPKKIKTGANSQSTKAPRSG
jgi:hypothetical protein